MTEQPKPIKLNLDNEIENAKAQINQIIGQLKMLENLRAQGGVIELPAPKPDTQPTQSAA